MDAIGMQTMYNIEMLWGEKNNDQLRLDKAAMIKSEFIDKGNWG